MPAYDAIVLGLGGMGSATLFHLARRGLRVLGLERFDLVHEYGSSHGLTRIIRLAYWEHPTYVALLRRAYELWRELESLAGERLLYITGSVDAGPEGGPIFEGALKSSELHGLTHEVMDGDELHRRYPGYRLPREIRCLYQPDGGFLLPERCDVAHIEQALAHGAEVRYREPVMAWDANGGRVQVRTTRGRYEAGRLVICAGPWASRLVPELNGLAVPERQVLAWLQPSRPEYFRLGAFPVFNLEVEEGRYYGFPSFLIPGFKFGRYHHRGEQVDPDAMNREPEPADEELLRDFARRYFPDGAGADPHAQDLPLHQQPRPPLHPGPPSCTSGGRRRCRVLGPRLQVLQRGRRSDGRPRRGEPDSPRHRVLPTAAIPGRHLGGAPPRPHQRNP